ncbi:hypothetical protein [Bacillus gaemokensis]|uniref:Uncharacterized protein n=1 Tax=Bacillus gaemokensis TaxID=574375 RepID=A0A073KNE1_9BACI|nr:hypothetical protein [Bacillus gaemokensis]KEK23893.1 hypothetical protein BAGA_05480 [Bacillus gaemokensis]KYG38134.1 hypothetical protein AZF08_20515 [Bacillus gaemokensis]
MFSLFKKKVDKVVCSHKWHHLQDTYISANHMCDVDDACYIFCSKCEMQKLVIDSEWERIKKMQEIIDDEKPRYKFVLKITDSKTGNGSIVIVKGNDIKKVNKSTVIIDEVEMAFGVFEYIAEINAYSI